MKREPTAREAAECRPCVVIEWVDGGGIFIHADEGVDVFNRHENPETPGLYQYTNLPIPDEWLDEPAIPLGEEQVA